MNKKLKSISLFVLKIVGALLTVVIVVAVFFVLYFTIRSYIDPKIEKQIDIKFHKELLQVPQLKIISFKLWEGDSIVQAEIEKKGTIYFWYGIDGVPRIDSVGHYQTSYDCFYINSRGEKENYAYTKALDLNNNTGFERWFSFKIHNLKDMVDKYDAVVKVLETFPKNLKEVDFKDNSGERKVLQQSNAKYILHQMFSGRKVQCDLFNRL